MGLYKDAEENGVEHGPPHNCAGNCGTVKAHQAWLARSKVQNRFLLVLQENGPFIWTICLSSVRPRE